MIPNENTNPILKKDADLMKVQLDDKQISTSHRLKTNSNNLVDTSKQKIHPPIVVRFSNQDKRNEFFRKGKLIIPSLKTNKSFVKISPHLENFYTLKPRKQNKY